MYLNLVQQFYATTELSNEKLMHSYLECKSLYSY